MAALDWFQCPGRAGVCRRKPGRAGTGSPMRERFDIGTRAVMAALRERHL